VARKKIVRHLFTTVKFMAMVVALLSLASFVTPLFPAPLVYVFLIVPLAIVTLLTRSRICYALVFLAFIIILIWAYFYAIPNIEAPWMWALTFIFPIAAGIVGLLLWESVGTMFSSLYEISSRLPFGLPETEVDPRERYLEKRKTFARLVFLYLTYFILSLLVLVQTLLISRILGITFPSPRITYLTITLMAVSLSFLNRVSTFMVSGNASKSFTYSLLTIFMGTFLIGYVGGKLQKIAVPLIDDVAIRNETIGIISISLVLLVTIGEMILKPLTESFGRSKSFLVIAERLPIFAHSIEDSRGDFMNEANRMANEAQEEILILTQTFGKRWGALKETLKNIGMSKENIEIKIAGPACEENAARIADLMQCGSCVKCNHALQKSSVKFMIVDRKKLLLGIPSERLGEREEYPESRWGYVFDDPIVTTTFWLVFCRLFEDGLDGSEALLREVTRELQEFVPSGKVSEELKLAMSEKSPKSLETKDGRNSVRLEWDEKSRLINAICTGESRKKVLGIVKEFIKAKKYQSFLQTGQEA